VVKHLQKYFFNSIVDHLQKTVTQIKNPQLFFNSIVDHQKEEYIGSKWGKYIIFNSIVDHQRNDDQDDDLKAGVFNSIVDHPDGSLGAAEE